MIPGEIMTNKEQYLYLLNANVPSSLLHHNINVYNKKNQEHPEVSIFTNSKGKLVLRFNPWDEVDGIKVVR